MPRLRKDFLPVIVFFDAIHENFQPPVTLAADRWSFAVLPQGTISDT